MRHSDQARLGVLLLAVSIGGMLAMASCNHVTGPALSAKVESMDLRPTSTTADALDICCCRVHGFVRNTSEIAVDLALRFHVGTADGQCPVPPAPWSGTGPTPPPVSDQNGCTAQEFLADVLPGQVREFSAPGIFAACSKVSSTIEPDVRIIGHFDATH